MTQTRILVVDDSDADFQLLQAHLRRRNQALHTLRVDSACTLETALLDTDWEAVVCDHSMPGFSSHEALSIVARLRPSVPVIVYSGDLDEETGLGTLRRGANDFIPKGKYQRLLNALDREISIATLKTEKAQAEHLARQAGLFDELTGLPNRTHYLHEAEDLLKSALTQAQQSLLLHLSIDRYQQIIDSFGKVMGDALVKSLTQRLQSSLRDAKIYRFDPDQFGIWISSMPSGQTPQEWFKLIETRVAGGLTVDGQVLYPTFSIGLAICPQHAASGSRLLSLAEAASQAAARLGGNRCKIHEDEGPNPPESGHDDAQLVQSAIAEHRTRLHLLPLFKGAAAKVVGMRMLVYAEVSPLTWRAAAVVAGPLVQAGALRFAIDQRLIEGAFQQLQRWRELGAEHLRLRIDLLELPSDPANLCQMLKQQFEICPTALSQLEIGFSENFLMRDGRLAQSLVEALKSLTVNVALTDFGSGYCALPALASLAIDTFVLAPDVGQCMQAQPADVDWCKLALAMADQRGARLVCPGFANINQAQAFIASGGDYWELQETSNAPSVATHIKHPPTT